MAALTFPAPSSTGRFKLSTTLDDSDEDRQRRSAIDVLVTAVRIVKIGERTLDTVFTRAEQEANGDKGITDGLQLIKNDMQPNRDGKNAHHFNKLITLATLRDNTGGWVLPSLRTCPHQDVSGAQLLGGRVAHSTHNSSMLTPHTPSPPLTGAEGV